MLTPWPENVPYPTPDDIVFPKGITHGIVHDCERDPQYKFLHETAVGQCNGSIFVAWYNNYKAELSGKTLQRGRWSKDHGQTWSDPEIVMDEGNDKGRKFVGIQFLNQNGDFYAFSNEEVEGGFEKLVHMLLLVFDQKNKQWKTIAPIAPRFLAMQQPILMGDGNYIIVGSYNPFPGGSNGVIPAVYVSQGKEIAKPWERFLIDTEYVNVFAETAIVVNGPNILAVTRVEKSPQPYFYVSSDYGRTWKRIANRSFYASASKFAAGTLTNGVRYILYNLPDFKRDTQGNVIESTLKRGRKTLVMATSQPGEKYFSRIWKISDPSTSTAQLASHYPCALEFDGKLYITYTGQHRLRNCGISIVPVSSFINHN
ncbi:MAG: sialidase family protein [Planctomycetia bacterium]|nr:sialidase family protein [Planctomycetia bacterium]